MERINHNNRTLGVAYPVALMLSMISRIFRLWVLWRGSDSPTPSGGGDELDAIEVSSNVVVKEEIEETEEARLLCWLEGMGSPNQPGQLYKYVLLHRGASPKMVTIHLYRSELKLARPPQGQPAPFSVSNCTCVTDC